MYVGICMYVCMYGLCMYICMYVCMYVCMYENKSREKRIVRKRKEQNNRWNGIAIM